MRVSELTANRQLSKQSGGGMIPANRSLCFDVVAASI
jgi:hypothetical protein